MSKDAARRPALQPEMPRDFVDKKDVFLAGARANVVDDERRAIGRLFAGNNADVRERAGGAQIPRNNVVKFVVENKGQTRSEIRK